MGDDEFAETLLNDPSFLAGLGAGMGAGAGAGAGTAAGQGIWERRNARWRGGDKRGKEDKEGEYSPRGAL